MRQPLGHSLSVCTRFNVSLISDMPRICLDKNASHTAARRESSQGWRWLNQIRAKSRVGDAATLRCALRQPLPHSLSLSVCTQLTLSLGFTQLRYALDMSW